VRGNAVNVATSAGRIKLAFSEPVSNGILSVCLFDLNGRLAATLFKGRISSPHLSIPLDGTGIRTGAYVARISLDDKTVVKNILTFDKNR
jgi:hypothetical protein